MTTQYINLLPHEAKAAAEKRLGMLIRMVEPQPSGDISPLSYVNGIPNTDKWVGFTDEDAFVCPFGPPGTVLHCREEWGIKKADFSAIVFRSDGDDSNVYVWRPAELLADESIRFRPTVREVRCKRAQDVTEEEAKAWGVPEAIRTEQVDSIEQEDFDAIWCPYLTEMRGILEEDLKLIRWEENPWLWLATLTND